jgi:dipeptidyl aminopeptidase/acylaminoacyl peptidase
MDNVIRSGRALAIQPEDLAKIAWINDADLTTDGSRVAYTISELSIERDEVISAIWVSEVGESGTSVQFTHGSRRDSNPKWSPDGRFLAFLSERNCPDLTGSSADRPQVYVMPSAGGEARRMTSASGGVTQFAWSPDSSRLVVVARVPTLDQEAPKPGVVGDRGPSKPFRVVTTLKYRRNGEGFIDSRRHLFLVQVNALGETIQITHGEYDHSDPAWSPDGSEIAFVTARHESRDTDNAQSVMVANVSHHNVTKANQFPVRTIVDPLGPTGFPVWSPDGKYIAFAGHQYALDTGRHTRIWVASVAGGQLHAVSDSLDRNVSANQFARPTWVDGGESLLFTLEDDGSTVLVKASRPDRVKPSEGDTLQIISGERREISAFSFSEASSTIVISVSDCGMPPAIHRLTAIDGVWHEEVVRNHNEAWQRTKEVGSVTRLSVSRPDGSISVWVHLPPGADHAPMRSIPALVSIHGGPHAQYGDRFFDEFAVYSGAGYAVIFSNPHGSTGRSEAFTRSVREDWGGVDASDVLAAVDEAIASTPCLDPDRMGIMGGSYGGYLTSWIVAHDHRFRAACSERAVNDFGSFAGTSDIGFWFAEGQLGASPFDDPALAAKHSPLTFAADIRTPLLIMHAEQDYRCPIEQAERLFVALARRDRPVRFIRVPDADHELSRSGRPRQRIERFRHILEWFALHLHPTPIDAIHDI